LPVTNMFAPDPLSSDVLAVHPSQSAFAARYAPSFAALVLLLGSLLQLRAELPLAPALLPVRLHDPPPQPPVAHPPLRASPPPFRAALLPRPASLPPQRRRLPFG